MTRGSRKLPLVFLGAAIAAAIGFGVAAATRSVDDTTSVYGYLRLFNEVLSLVRNSYVEEDVAHDALMKGAYDGLLASLDGESEYITAASWQAIRSPKPGSEADAGIALTRREGVLFVTAVLPGSEAKAKGLRVGDQVRRIGDRNGRDLTLAEAEMALRGPAGSKITLSVSRREEPKREDVELSRKKHSISAPKLEPAQEGVAVVGIPSFAPGSAKALGGILDRLHKDRIRRAVFDLRGNAWGDIEEAARAASLLMEKGPVATLKGRHGEEKPIAGSGVKSPYSGQILLLTDPGTSYAAEVFVAALVDAGAAKQGGEPTLGRGGEREALPLANGDVLYLTVRKLVSPSGKSWHGTGLSPSISLPSDQSVPFKERADRQLKKAVEWIRDASEGAKAAA